MSPTPGCTLTAGAESGARNQDPDVAGWFSVWGYVVVVVAGRLGGAGWMGCFGWLGMSCGKT